MHTRQCPHDGRALVELSQHLFPVHVQAPDSSRLTAMVNPGVRARPHVCVACGYVGLYVEPAEASALVSGARSDATA